MRFHRQILCVAIFGLIASWTILSVPRAPAQQSGEAPASDATVIKAQTRLVLVDTVVTDKKGSYIRDLTAKDFKVWEDNKEQAITSFSFEDETASTDNSARRYLVLFFDNSTMDMGDQARARQAAAQFIDANSGPNHLMAIVDFGGTIQIAQNFTSDADRLKQVVSGLKMSAVSPNAQTPVQMASLGAPPPDTIAGVPNFNDAEADFGVQTVMLALRTLAKDLSSVPGRKTLVMLTAGFPLTPQHMSELTAVIDACNKANVAVYPIDVRGLVASLPPPGGAQVQPLSRGTARLIPAALRYSETPGSTNPHLVRVAALFAADPPQHGGGGSGGAGGGGGSGGGGGHGGGGTGSTGGGTSGGSGGAGGGHGGGTTGGSGGHAGGGTSAPGNTATTGLMNPYNQPRQIIPQFPDSASTNQQVLYALADGTGGFVIVNTNDLLGGLEKIAKDQSQYYSLGYKPAESQEGSCHTLRVKVERSGTVVRARSGYCNVRPRDLLAGNSVEKDLETRATNEMPGNVAVSAEVPFFYTSPNTARVNLAMEIPSSAIKFAKEKGKQHSAVNVLGIAYGPNNSIAARFSDTVNLDFEDKKEIQNFEQRPFHYENQFDLASGQYSLRVVFSSGSESFGKIVVPLVIEPYDGKQFSLSALALSNEFHPVSEMATGLDAALLEDRKPLVTRGMQIVPSASDHFKTTDNVALYVEVYAPALLGANPPKVGVEIRVTDRKTGKQISDVGVSDLSGSIQAGNPVIPLGLKLPLTSPTAGSYRVELRALDSIGGNTSFHSADFELE
jgi:VWFA-related protein